MNSERTLAISLPDKTVQDLLAAHLYAMTVVNDDEDILNINLSGVDTHGHRHLEFKIKQKRKEVKVTRKDG